MKIKQTIDRFPGGMMIVPLLLGAVIRTIAPGMFHDSVFAESFTGGLLKGIDPLLGAFYVCLGSTIRLRAARYVLKKGVSLWLGKVLVAAALVLLIRWLAPDQNHIFLGLSALAVVAAFSDTNGGLYMALLGQLGKREDVAACAIISVESGPFFSMLILGVVGLASFPVMAFVYVLVPLAAGMILGNLDPEMRDFLSKGTDVLIPLFALALGASINLKDVVTAGGAGIFLGFCVVVISGLTLLLVDKLTGGNGINGIAAGSTAGNASVVPAAIGALYAGYRGIAPTATVQVAASVIVTAIVIPFVAGWYSRHVQRKAGPPAQGPPSPAQEPQASAAAEGAQA